MTIEDLQRTVVDGFERMDERFVANEQRSDRVDQRLVRIDARFDRIDERFEGIEREFVSVREEMHGIQVHLEARIREEGETTRRHFEIMVERIEAAVRVVAEGHTHLRTVAEDHEARLQAIEKRA